MHPLTMNNHRHGGDTTIYKSTHHIELFNNFVTKVCNFANFGQITKQAAHGCETQLAAQLYKHFIQ